MPKAYIYVRVSTHRQEQSPEEQIETLRAVAAEKFAGYDVVELKDLGISGFRYKLSDRPAGRRLCNEARKGDAVLIKKIDRLGRRAPDALHIASSLLEGGIYLYVHQPIIGAPRIIQPGAKDEIELFIAALVAACERNATSERTAAIMAWRKQHGLPTNGSAPPGIKLSGPRGNRYFMADPAEAALVAEILSLTAAGWNMYKIWLLFLKRKERTRHGKEWTYHRIRRVVQSPPSILLGAR